MNPGVLPLPKLPGATFPDSAELLQILARLTQADSADALRQRFAETLARILPLSGLSFYAPGSQGRLDLVLACQVYDEARQPNLIWQREPRRNIMPQGALARCLQERSHQFPPHDHRLDFFPVNGRLELIEIIELSQRADAPNRREQIKPLLQIYANVLRILHEREIDPQTGLLNRHAFDIALSASTQLLRHKPRLHPGATQCWLLLIDIDHLKVLNQSYGHKRGDELLRQLARLMEQSFRSVDRIYRFGGDQFAVLLSPCSHRNALNSAERLRQRAEQVAFIADSPISVSIGLAPIDRFDHSANLLGHAELALFQAKRKGRNRVAEFIEPAGRLAAGQAIHSH